MFLPSFLHVAGDGHLRMRRSPTTSWRSGTRARLDLRVHGLPALDRTRSLSLAGALIFGFSPYIVSQSVGHLAQTLIMSAPLILIVLDRLLVVQASKPWLDGLLLGVLAWAQLLTGEEVLALEAVVAADRRGRNLRDKRPGHLPSCSLRREGPGRSGASFVVLSLPFLAYQYLGPAKVQDVHPPTCT